MKTKFKFVVILIGIVLILLGINFFYEKISNFIFKNKEDKLIEELNKDEDWRKKEYERIESASYSSFSLWNDPVFRERNKKRK